MGFQTHHDSSSGHRARSTLRTVELTRGLAALAVALFHSNSVVSALGGPDLGWTSFGERGVDFFFVLSGFIIVTAHGGDIAAGGRARQYLAKRAIRLLPLLWLVVIAWTVQQSVVGRAPEPGMVLRSLTLVPSLEMPIPNVVWTLRHEALFYVMFVLLLVSPRVGRVAFGLWTAGIVGQLALTLVGEPIGAVGSFLLTSYYLDFGLGMLVAWAHRRWTFEVSWRPLLVAGIGLAMACVVEKKVPIHRLAINDYVTPAAQFWTLLLGLLFALALHGLLRVEPVLAVPQWAVTLGAASYAIYLVHTLVYELLKPVWPMLPLEFVRFGGAQALLTIIGVAAGLTVHRFVERPMTRALRARFVAQAAKAPTSTAAPTDRRELVGAGTR